VTVGVIGGVGVDTIVRVPSFEVLDSVGVEPIQECVAHTGNGVALGLHRLEVPVRFVDFIGADAQA
jgi:hypothetical protein